MHLNIPQIRHKHPTWTDENINFLHDAEDSWEFIKTETLLENRCVECKKEMGEHKWRINGFVCP